MFDLTTTAMWTGPPVGIVRVEHQLARWGRDHVDGLISAFFDPMTGAYRQFRPDMAMRLMMQDAAIDTLNLPNPERRGKRKSERIPAAIRPYLMWILQSRRQALQALERVRLRSKKAPVVAAIDVLQRAIMSRKYRRIMVTDDGARRTCYPLDMVLGAPIEFSSTDTLVCAGAGWAHHDIAVIAALKRERGFRFVLLCHDIIPLMFPQFYKPHDVESQRRYVDIAFAAADVVVCTSRRVAADVRAYCETHRIALRGTAVVAPGADAGSVKATAPLPAGLERGRYALLVSTIEPRKGHRMIYGVWRALLAAGIPQAHRFKLVFVGRKGWLVDDLMKDLRNDPGLAGTLLVMTDIADAAMATLYENAAFCLYPSLYEGYGLPLVEAFFHGKAVLASTGGAVPEVVGEFSPCIDPQDVGAWTEMFRTWIEQPAARLRYEDRIRSEFRHPSWDQSAKMFFDVVQRGPAQWDHAQSE